MRKGGISGDFIDKDDEILKYLYLSSQHTSFLNPLRSYGWILESTLR